MTLISVLVVGGAPGVLHASEHPCSQMLESRYEEFRKAHGSWTKVDIDDIHFFDLLEGRPIKLYNKSLGQVVAEGTIGIGTGVHYNPYWVSDFNDSGSSTYIYLQIMSPKSFPVTVKNDIKDLANVEAWVKVFSFDALSKYPDDVWHPVTTSFSDPFSIVAANGKAAIVGAVVAFGLKIGSSVAVSDIAEGMILDVTPAGYSLMPRDPGSPSFIKADRIFGARVRRPINR